MGGACRKEKEATNSHSENLGPFDTAEALLSIVHALPVPEVAEPSLEEQLEQLNGAGDSLKSLQLFLEVNKLRRPAKLNPIMTTMTEAICTAIEEGGAGPKAAMPLNVVMKMVQRAIAPNFLDEWIAICAHIGGVVNKTNVIPDSVKEMFPDIDHASRALKLRPLYTLHLLESILPADLCEISGLSVQHIHTASR